MAGNDYNVIKPVEQAQNISSLKPINKREKRKQKHRFGKESEKENRPEREDVMNEPMLEDENSQNSTHKIDYRA